MKKKISFIIASVSLFAVGAAVTAAVFPNANQVTQAYTGTFNPDAPLKPSYNVGDHIDIPTGKIDFKGETITPISRYVVSPSGVAQNLESISFLEQGNYQVVYQGLNSSGKTVTAVLNILVYNKAYSVNKEGSYARYTNTIITNSKPTPGVEGMLVSGDTFTYGNVIDISNSSLETPIIKYYTHTYSELAQNIGIDAYYSVVRLTDYYDPSIYVDISIGHYEANHSTGRMQQYVVAGASNQSMTGCLKSNSTATGTRKNVTIDDVNYVCYFGTNDYGSILDTKPGKGNVYGVDISNSDNLGYSVFYDSTSKQIYVRHDTLHFITDLDNSSIYDRNTFKGFTTGEVILSLSFNTYVQNSAGFEIESIYGLSGEKLDQTDATDVKAPEIVLDNKHDNFSICVDEEFEIFKATSLDLHPAGEVEAEVYYEYGNINESYVPLINNRFIPRKPGKYSIIYTARDVFNNTTIKIVNCTAVHTHSGSIIDFSVDKVTSALAGSIVNLNEPVIVSRNFEAQYEIYLIYEDGSLEMVDNSFRLKKVGKYEIRYVYTDGIFTKTFSYELTSKPSSVPFIDQFILPEFLIKGSNITLDSNLATNCESKDGGFVECDVFDNVDGNGYRSTPIDPENYNVTANSTVQFKYVYNGQTVEESEPIDVVDVNFTGSLNLLNYFDGDLSKAFNGSKGVKFTAKNENTDNKVAFINPLSLSLFSIDLVIPAEIGKNCESVNLYLVDYYKPDYQEKISLFSVNGTLKMKINDDLEYAIGETDHTQLYFDPIKRNLEFVRPNSIGKAAFGDNILNEKFYLIIEASGVKDDCSFVVNQIGNHILNNRSYDAFAPETYIYPFDGTYAFGSKIYLSPLVCGDVLSPYLKSNYELIFEYTNARSETVFAVSDDGVVLDGTQDLSRGYYIDANKYGTYAATCFAKDQCYRSGTLRPNSVTNSTVANVIDDVAPEIIVSTVTEYASLGSAVNVRACTVKDNIDDMSKIKLRIYVISPSGVMTNITNVRAFVADEVGTYQVVYYAVDSSDNSASASYSVVVM